MAKNIPIATVQLAIDNSICFGVYRSTVQIGFARVITDKVTFTYLADVFIINEQQGNGFAKHLMNTIYSHSELL